MRTTDDHGLWNDDVDSHRYEGAGERYQPAILEQYKLYVEMADRVSSRRGLTNFFLTLNTLVFTIIGAFIQERPEFSAWLLALPLAIALGQCAGW